MVAVSYLSHFIQCIVGMALVDQSIELSIPREELLCDEHKEILTVRVS